MNHYQLRRDAVYPILLQNQLLISFTTDAGKTQCSSLALYGRDLLEKLCAAYNIEIAALCAEDSFLQGSLAKFEPYSVENQDWGGIIYFSEQLEIQEQVFAIAHELAHFHLHWGQPNSCHIQDLEAATTDENQEVLLSGQVEVYNPRNLREREANTFALELLMPAEELYFEYSRLKKSNPAGTVGELAQHFGVSVYRALMQLANVFLNEAFSKSRIERLEPPQLATSTFSLDAEQQTAVEVATPALILAGPGSGKTRTLVERVRYLVESAPQIDPAQILILTFSNKAASELRERLALAGLPAEKMLISTFHAYGVEFLRRYAERAGLARDFRLLDPAHAYMFMEELLPYFPNGYYVNIDKPLYYLTDLLADISRAKDYLHTPEDYANAVERMTTALNPQGGVYKPEDITKARERALIYKIYEEHKKNRNLVDFSDLALLPVKLLEADPQVLNSERQRYRQVLVDEFQDINYASGKLLECLCSPHSGGAGNLWAVGDLNQSIYRFRGAFPKQAGAPAFSQNFGSNRLPATVLELSCNYRSLPDIVNLANHLRTTMDIDGATLPLQAKRAAELETLKEEEQNQQKPQLFYTFFPSTDVEMATIASNIERNRQLGYAYADHAILCQRHNQADKLAEVLTLAGIPVSRLGPFFSRSEIQEVRAFLTLLNEDSLPALVRLGENNLDGLTLASLAGEYSLSLRAALRSSRVLGELDKTSATFAAYLVSLLEKFDNYRSMWLLIVQYLFEHSPTLTKLVQTETESFANRQKLKAFGQLLRLAGAFDREEEAALYQAEERKLKRPLTFEEKELLRQNRLRPGQQRQHFLRYINALVQSDTRIELGNANAATSRLEGGRVQIITAHTSKGLEFPFVYLPGLHHSNKVSNEPTLPSPPDFHFDNAASQQADQRCLFYVAATRARDSLYLSWAKHDEQVEAKEADEDSSFKVGRKSADRRPIIELEVALRHKETYPAKWATLAPVEVTRRLSPNDSPKSLANLMPPPVVEFNKLELYEKCPARYYYQYLMQSHNGVRTRSNDEKAVLYQALAVTQKELYATLSKQGALPDLVQLLTLYDNIWKKAGVSNILNNETASNLGDLPKSYYHLQGQAALQAVYQHYQNQENANLVAVEFDVEQTVQLKNSLISFKIERVEHLADGSKRLVHSRLKPLPKNEDNIPTETYRRLTLYALAYSEAAETDQVIIEAVGPNGLSQLVASKAWKKAQTYQKWLSKGGKDPGLLDKVDKLAIELKAGKFEVKKGEHCTRCPFYTLLCPIKPN